MKTKKICGYFWGAPALAYPRTTALLLRYSSILWSLTGKGGKN